MCKMEENESYDIDTVKTIFELLKLLFLQNKMDQIIKAIG